MTRKKMKIYISKTIGMAHELQVTQYQNSKKYLNER